MLPQTFGAIRKRRGFLNLSTGERFLADLPELRHQHVFGRTSDGLIVLCNKATYAVSLPNPLTRQLTAFPNGTTIYPPESQTIPGWSNSRLAELQALGAGPADDDSSAMALHFDEHHLAVAKPGAERWSLWARCWSIPVFATVSFASRFYCATEKGIMAVEFTADNERPQLVVAVEAEHGCTLECPDPNTLNLVDNDGELILVSSSTWPRMAKLPGKYEVHRVDLDAGKVVPMHGLRGRAVFVGEDCHGLALSVPAGLSSSIRADTVYRCSERSEDDGWRVDAYHLLDGSVEHDFRGGKTVDYLSRYICRSDDTVVSQSRRKSDWEGTS